MLFSLYRISGFGISMDSLVQYCSCVDNGGVERDLKIPSAEEKFNNPPSQGTWVETDRMQMAVPTAVPTGAPVCFPGDVVILNIVALVATLFVILRKGTSTKMQQVSKEMTQHSTEAKV